MIYEVVWLKLLQAATGLPPVSLGIVMGTFIGGLYLGGLLPSRISSRQNPTRVFALLELGLGVLGVIVLFVLPALAHGLSSMLVRTGPRGRVLTLPALLMGATLQSIASWVEATPRNGSWLYGGSLAGAILGCLLAGFYLLSYYDPAITTYVAVLINVVLAMVAFGLSNFLGSPASEPAGAGTTGAGGALGVYLAIALSGLGTVGGAIVWTQSFSMLSGIATHTALTVYYFPMVLSESKSSRRYELLCLRASKRTVSTLKLRLPRPVPSPDSAIGSTPKLLPHGGPGAAGSKMPQKL